MTTDDKEIDAKIGREGLTQADRERGTREFRDALRNDPARPKWHLLPPEGFWNDINGTIFWKGRYHVFFLGRRSPDREAIVSGKDSINAREVWLHASSRDLVHWVHHPIALIPAWDGSMPNGIYSGDMIADAPQPTIIVHIPKQGTCIYTADDDMLDNWKWHPANPVITQEKAPKEVTVFDPTGWYDKEEKTYYALIGNKNRTPGFEGDTSSLFKSTDLATWEYVGPFYKSERKWTEEACDCACPDFYPLGDKKMLLMHSHKPYYMAQYYLGHLDGERFIPELHGRMTWPGGSLCAPETLLDDKGRRVFWGWVYEQGPVTPGWGSVATLPRVFDLDVKGRLKITPAPELETLRMNPRRFDGIALADGGEHVLDVRGDSLEIDIDAEYSAADLIVTVRRSPDAQEATAVIISPAKGTMTVDFSKSRQGQAVKFPRFRKEYNDSEKIPESEWYTSQQAASFKLEQDEPLRLRIFLDRSILEVFANERQCITQRIYPSRTDSLGVSLAARGGKVNVRSFTVYEMERVNSW
ncbi:MAG: glycoside hydrolase family 32 protein [Spirochaetes bacterium]|nr:glycoside hydrolase family 32 protein [Spirochaetota bacterium]